eukprot:scaffold647930_cov31-Prasinocladus_malaysianus.AAC.1
MAASEGAGGHDRPRYYAIEAYITHSGMECIWASQERLIFSAGEVGLQYHGQLPHHLGSYLLAVGHCLLTTGLFSTLARPHISLHPTHRESPGASILSCHLAVDLSFLLPDPHRQSNIVRFGRALVGGLSG